VAVGNLPDALPCGWRDLHLRGLKLSMRRDFPLTLPPSMMKSSHLGQPDPLAELWLLDPPAHRSIAVQRQMATTPIVVLELSRIRKRYSSSKTMMVQALPTKGSDNQLRRSQQEPHMMCPATRA